MRFIFISFGDYPDQRASSIRHSTIAKGLVEEGHNVNFFVLSSQTWINEELDYHGVKFKCLNHYNGDNKLLRILYYILSLFNLIIETRRINKSNTIDGIIVYSRKSSILQTALFISSTYNISCFHERTELPYIIGKSETLIGKLKYEYYLNRLIPRLKAIFVISDKLANFFVPFNKRVKKILTVVDTEFFSPSQDSIYNFPYIAYCGTMEGRKDGVPILIKSFAKLHKYFPDYRLILVGDNSEEKIGNIVKLIDEYSIQDKVKFTGFVDREKMPIILGGADLLVVAKPDNEQNSGNFPIKVGEYLATGVPTVLTKVGEIPKFLEDEETSYLSEPDSVVAFFEKMKQALLDYEKANIVGQRGRELAKKMFDYKIQAKEMAQYIKKMNLEE